MNTLLGLGGHAFAGKDTVADFFVEKDGWLKDYMSRPLEEILLALDPYVFGQGGVERYSYLYSRVGYAESKKNPEVRRLLQVIGTEIGREILGEDIWVQAMDSRVSEALQTHSVAVTGIRFQNEVDWIRRRGGIAAWVDRGGKPVNDHDSDNSLGPDDFDFVIPNRGSLEDLYRHLNFQLKGLK